MNGELAEYYTSRLSEQDKRILLDIYKAGSISMYALMDKYTANIKEPESFLGLFRANRELENKCRELVLAPTKTLKSYGFITVSEGRNNALKICVLTELGLSVVKTL